MVLRVAAIVALGLAVCGEAHAQTDLAAPATPASLARIRRALSNPAPLRITPAEATFRVVIREKAPVSLFGAPRDAWESPRPPGGLYGSEQRQRLGNPWMGQPLIQFDLLSAASAVRASVRDARRQRQQDAADDDVAKAIAEFCVVNACEPVGRPQR